MARAEGREGLEGLVCHGLGVEVVVEVVAVVGGGAADNGGDGGGESDENFSRLQGGWGKRETDGLVAVGKLAVEGGGREGGGRSGENDGRKFSIFRRGCGKSKRGL